MNIDDVKEELDIRDEDIPEAIFLRQRELMEKYHTIEKASGLVQTDLVPVDINTGRGQARLKDFMWRVTEELMESMEAQFNGDKHHAKEEWADALHFMVELGILSGRTFDLFPKPGILQPMQANDAMIQEATFWVVYGLGLAANCLKQKPWKQTHILTDTQRYQDNLSKAFHGLIVLGNYHNMELQEMASYYFKKSRVNQFRQRSQY